MSENCCPAPAPSADPRYRRILWIALAVNAAMFIVELWASAVSGSAAFAKGLAMGAYGIGVFAFCAWRIAAGAAPEAVTMGIIGTLALAANLMFAWMLYAYREGDANMRAVWLCTRNDAISNLAVLAAAAGVFGTGSFWPDVTVAALMASLALHSAVAILRQSRREIEHAKAMPAAVLRH